MGMALANLVANSPGLTISLLGIQHAAITEARNRLVRQALAVKADYLFWLDSDIVAPPDALVRLLGHKKHIVGASYVQKAEPFGLHGAPCHPKNAQTGVAEFHFMPGGCMLVKARVYREIAEPWYFESYDYSSQIDRRHEFFRAVQDAIHATIPLEVVADLAKSEKLMAWLDGDGYADLDPLDGDGYADLDPLTVTRSEDTNFCRKAKRYGYRIWCDLDLTGQLVHMGSRACSVHTMAEHLQKMAAAEKGEGRDDG